MGKTEQGINSTPTPTALCRMEGDRDRGLEFSGETGRDSDRRRSRHAGDGERHTARCRRHQENGGLTRLKALVVEAGRGQWEGVGIFKNSEEGGSGNWGFQCQHYATFSTRILSQSQGCIRGVLGCLPLALKVEWRSPLHWQADIHLVSFLLPSPHPNPSSGLGPMG